MSQQSPASIADYHTDAGFTVTGQLQGNTLTLRTSAAALGLGGGGHLYSVTAFSMAGPARGRGAYGRLHTMRTVDALPPFDRSVAAQR